MSSIVYRCSNTTSDEALEKANLSVQEGNFSKVSIRTHLCVGAERSRRLECITYIGKATHAL